MYKVKKGDKTLFVQSEKANIDSAAPLAVRMRPRNLDEFLGQRHFLGPGKLLTRMLQADRLSSLIFYGPPGIGKTSLAAVITNYTKAKFHYLSAPAASVKDIRQIIAAAGDRLAVKAQRTVLFIDEIHRFNRAQQDVLLDDVESGVLILIGATTENPFFSVNSPLISRSTVFVHNWFTCKVSTGFNFTACQLGTSAPAKQATIAERIITTKTLKSITLGISPIAYIVLSHN